MGSIFTSAALPAATSLLSAGTSIYNNERNIGLQRETNAQMERIHNEDKVYNSEQSEINRDFIAGQQQIAQDFNASQADLNRQFQADEATKSRNWQQAMVSQSIRDTARTYEQLGINPVNVLSSQPSVASSSFGAGSSASVSPAGGSASASAPSAPSLTSPRADANPAQQFIDAFNASQLTQSQVNQRKVETAIKDKELQYYDRLALADLRKRHSEVKANLSKADLTDQERKNLIKQEKSLDWQIKLQEATYDTSVAMSKQQLAEQEQRVKSITLSNVAETIKNEWLPKLLSSQVNLNNSQAQAALMCAQAALEQAVTARVDATTHRMAVVFDAKKWVSVYKEQAEAATNNLNANTEFQERQTTAVSQNQLINLVGIGVGAMTNALKQSMSLVGGSLILKGVKTGSVGNTNSFTNASSTPMSDLYY